MPNIRPIYDLSGVAKSCQNGVSKEVPTARSVPFESLCANRVTARYWQGASRVAARCQQVAAGCKQDGTRALEGEAHLSI